MIKRKGVFYETPCTRFAILPVLQPKNKLHEKNCKLTLRTTFTGNRKRTKSCLLTLLLQYDGAS